MIDITKENFFSERYLEVEKAPRRTNKLKDWVSKNKFMAIGTAVYVIIATINLFLIYYFFKLFSKL